MSVFLITTTGTASPVVINDLGARSFTHPTTSFDLTDEYTLEELRDSIDLRTAIDVGELTATLDGVAITSGVLFDTIMTDFLNARVAQNESDITQLQSDVAAITAGGRRFKKVIDVVDATAVPPTEVLGDRYWLDFTGTPNAAWDGVLEGQIAEFDGASWIVAGGGLEGDVAYNDTSNTDYVYVDDGAPSLESRDGAFQQNATQVPYTPTTVGDWDVVPTEVGGALDEVASRVETLENTPPVIKKPWTFSAGEGGKLNGDRDLKRTGAMTTNLSPFIVPITGTIWGISVASKQGINETFDIQVLVNGVVQHTQSVAASDKSFANNLAVAVTAGDEIRVRFILGTSGDVRDVGVEVFGIEA